jgi:hypothetical protein
MSRIFICCLILFFCFFSSLSAEIHEASDGRFYSDSRTVRFVPRLKESGPAETKAVLLYVSDDEGESWKEYGQSEKPGAVMIFKAPRDGTYLFATVAVDGLGQKESPPMALKDAELEVVVDTRAPKIRLQRDLIDLTAHPRDIKKIHWKTSDANPIDHVHIAYFDPVNRSWITKARLRDVDEYALEIPDFPWEIFRLRLQAVDAAGHESEAEILEFSLGARIVFPVSNISLPATSRRNILEMNLACDGMTEEEFSHFEVYYTLDEGQTWLLASTTKKGSLQWKVPRDGYYGFYSVAVSKEGTGEPLPRSGDLPKLHSLVDTQLPQLTIESPRGGERYSHDRPLTISWHGIEKNAVAKPVKIFYSRDDGISWLPLAEAPLSGAHHWNLEGFSGHLFRLKWVLEDKVGHVLEKISERFAVGSLNAEEKVQFDALFKRANALRVMGRLTEALEVYREALKYDVRHAATHNDMGVVYTQLKRWDKAIDAFERAIESQPANVEYLFNLGFSLYFNNMPELAEDVFLRLLEKDENYARAHWYLAEIRVLKGDVAGSKKHLQEILDIEDKRNQLKALAQKRLALYP